MERIENIAAMYTFRGLVNEFDFLKFLNFWSSDKYAPIFEAVFFWVNKVQMSSLKPTLHG